VLKVNFPIAHLEIKIVLSARGSKVEGWFATPQIDFSPGCLSRSSSLPKSCLHRPEKACSKRQESAVMSDITNRTKMARPFLNSPTVPSLVLAKLRLHWWDCGL
jgi:hypothetical protein